MTDPEQLTWRKSSHSLTNGTCVEVAATQPRRATAATTQSRRHRRRHP